MNLARTRVTIVAAGLVLLACNAGSGPEPSSSPLPVAEEGLPATCETNADCADAEYCAKLEGRCDDAGLCQTRPEVCTADYDPVCGCDGRTYGNACEAAAAGQNVRHRGECVQV